MQGQRFLTPCTCRCPCFVFPAGTAKQKGRGCLLEILKGTSKRYYKQDPVLWAWFEILFSLLRGAANTPGVHLQAKQHNMYQNCFFNTQKVWRAHPDRSYMEVPCPRVCFPTSIAINGRFFSFFFITMIAWMLVTKITATSQCAKKVAMTANVPLPG